MKNGRKQTPILYIKRGCPWCREATSFLSQHGVGVDIRDVNENASDMDRMVEISGQTLTPTFQYDDFVVADFSVQELQEELEQVPEIKKELGFGEEEDWQ